MPFVSDVRAMILAGVALLCLIFGIAQTVRLNGFLWIDGANDKVERLTIDNNELRAELRAISDKRDEQKAETGKRVEQAERGNREAGKVAERIERAPLPGQCKTPDAVMEADL